ncbi:protein S40-5-like [Primulina eburnea]|uniref:protein S40-5-like n=1 Tax=Primulina eburnea TaxID=1245227 RepID=UPI003C6C8C93
MAKGRTLTTSRSERYLGSFGSSNGQQTSNGAPELGEDEVWSLVDNTANGDDHSPKRERNSGASTESNRTFSIYSSRRPPPPVSHRQVGGLSLAFVDSNTSSSPRVVHQFRAQDIESPRGRHVATSAPVNVPDWSKIYRVNSVQSLHELEDDFNDNDLEVVPPHEYLAREYRRSRKAEANSVFEGVGRTLKGRDLSRVRDGVWSRTGFDG